MAWLKMGAGLRDIDDKQVSGHIPFVLPLLSIAGTSKKRSAQTDTCFFVLPFGKSMTDTTASSTLATVRDILVQTLQLSDESTLTEDTELLGNIPEIDSMAVVTILTALEEQYDFFIDDSEISAETFETLGTLVEFVDRKCSE